MAVDKSYGFETEHVNGLSGGAPVVPKVVQGVKSADDKIVALVRERPVVAICAALALGYMIGRVFTRIG